MTIEIFSDASVHLQSGDAGFAYWVSSMQTEYQYAGYMACNSSGTAELFSIQHAVDSLLQRELIPVERINIYTDSLDALHKITRGNRTLRESACFFTMIDFTIKNDMKPRQVFNLFKIIHVKAHTRSTDVDSYKNRWCDMTAKQHRVMKTEFSATIFDHSDILL